MGTDSLAQIIPQALVWLTSGGGAVMLWGAWRKWRDGRALAQRELEQQKAQERLTGQYAYELEARNRRKMQEYASLLRAVALGKGVCPEDLPPYPDLESVKDIFDADK